MLPSFVIVGAAKSGTTSLAAWLREHPDVYVVPEKELHFFSYEWERGVQWYEECFAAANGQAAVGEATPNYLAHPEAPERMASVIPDAKLIALLRNPVDRAYSHYWHWRERMGEQRSFEEVVSSELSGTPERYLSGGRYLEQLERVLKHYPREQLEVILFEDLQTKPEETFRQVCRYLGVDESAVPESVGSRENPFLYYYPRWLWNFFVRVRIGRFIPARAAGALYRAMVRTADPYPPMDPQLRMKLIDHFADSNAALAAWLGRDLSAWSK